MHRISVLAVSLTICLVQSAIAQYSGWQHSSSIYVITTPEGANLPATASEENFPVLVRLNKDFFNFSQAGVGGCDIRFATPGGASLAYQIEEWDAAGGTASVWVRVPMIKGKERQELRLFWGKADAVSESNGAGVFNDSNGYLSVWHMGDQVKDDAGTLESKDTGTASVPGIIAKARHFGEGKGINCGENITNYPSGSSPHTSEAWIRPEKANTTVLAWGNEQAQGKVVMQLESPPHIRMDCYFSGANVAGGSKVQLADWTHVVHAFKNGESRLYVNGILDGTAKSEGSPLNIRSPAKMWIGGWYNHFRFSGDIDEVRVSKVTRSADWVKLEYENQKLFQTLVGTPVQSGTDFSVSPAQVTVLEGKSVTVTGRADGAYKVYWILKSEAGESVAAVDRRSFTLDAGRVSGDTFRTLQFKAVYPDSVKTKDVLVTIKENIPDPIVTLDAPAKWDGRRTIELIPKVANLDKLKAAGVDAVKYAWKISGIAAIKEIRPDRLVLTRAQNSGNMKVTLATSNGGSESLCTATVAVTEPRKDPWVQRKPRENEQPADNQFYARDDKNEGTLYYNGVMTNAADSVFLRLFADEKVIKTETRKMKAGEAFAFTMNLKPGLVRYKVEFGTRTGKSETVLRCVTNIVCGDAYLIDGQSNALATDWGQGECPDTSEWVRSFGSNNGDVSSGWGNAVRRHGPREIGCWGMDLAKLLVEHNKMPICIINGAAGGTLIEMHQCNPANRADTGTIYGRMLNRIEKAGLTHGIRGAFWHQGENNQGTQGETGGYGWETYEQFFVDMVAAWKQDYPNIQHYYVFQIWPNSCSMGGTRASDKLRDVQRLLPRLYSNMSVMSTLGIKPIGPCHFPPAGYAEIAKQICPLVERDNYGRKIEESVTAPDLKRARYTGAGKDEIALEFDQPMEWDKALVSEFYLDGEKGVVDGSAAGNVVRLKLAAPSTAKTITYLMDRRWDPAKLLVGRNGIAALTFFEVPIE